MPYLPESNFTKDLNATYIDCIELVLDIEDVFEVEIPEKIFAELTTVEKVLDYVYQNSIISMGYVGVRTQKEEDIIPLKEITEDVASHPEEFNL